MKARYRELPGSLNNPFIEALPERLGTQKLLSAIASVPDVDDSVRALSQDMRLMCVNRLNEAFVPLTFAPTIYNLLYSGMVSSFSTKCSRDTILRTTEIKAAIDLGQRPQAEGFTTQAPGCAILGTPGIGKSSTIVRSLSLIPQVVEHIEYQGKPFFCKQINYLLVQCPADCSIKAICANILTQIDRVLGTEYALRSTRRQSVTLDALVAQLSQLCITHHIGVIIIDEIQNVLATSAKAGNNIKLIRFLVQLMNDTGICAVLVGTPEVGTFFDSQPHLARRTRGPRIAPLSFGPEFLQLLGVLWELQFTRYYEKLSDRLAGILYEISGGVPALLTQVLALSQTLAIETGSERLSEETIRKAVALYRLRAPSSASLQPAPSSPDGISVLTGSSQDNREARPQKRKGRPKAFRDANDLLEAKKHMADDAAFVKWLKECGWLERIPLC